MEGNIVGEPFEDFVAKQIEVRQKRQFSGKNSLRTDKDLQYLTNRNAWVKLASSVRIEEGTIVNITPGTTPTPPLPGSGVNIYTPGSGLGGLLGNRGGSSSSTPFPGVPYRTSTSPQASIRIAKSQRLQKIFGTGSTQSSNFPGTKLAESAVLFNTLSTYTGPNTPLQQRGGISNTNTLWNNNLAYGIGGTDFGIQPPPGIVSVQVDCINRGSIRKANVSIKAHNRFQFDVIELLYLRLGFTMMLEWGWDKFLNANGDLQQVENTIIETEWFTSNGITQLEMLNKIQAMREKYQGNVDAFFGKVSNFSWNFNPDGTYDITIDLITLGDVIESIKVNIPNKYTSLQAISEFETPEEAAEIYGNIAQSATLSALGAFLYKKAAFMKQGGYEGISSPTSGKGYATLDYFRLKPNLLNIANGGTSQYSADRYFYYVRLGTLLQLLQDYIIPQVVNGQSSAPQIIISTDELLNLASYFPNQIPLDPRVCVFKIDDAINKYGDITDIELNYSVLAGPIQLITRGGRALSQYVTKDTKSGLVHGKLMNLYMNMEFISELLISNGNTNQEFPLFKFLQDLCNGINEALGGVNKLEPVIKNDSTIVFVDQTLSLNEKTTVDLEVYGYNNVGQTSNFVKDVKFVSKITPQLASMISIGATAAGTSTSQIDGTAFSKWNDELTDRFAQKVEEPDIPALSGTSTSGTLTADEAAYLVKFDKNINPIVTVSFWEDLKILFGITEPDNIRRRILDPEYPTLNNKVMGFQTFFTLASAYDNEQRLTGRFKPEDLKEIVDRNYGYYLSQAFGGKSNSVSVWSNTTKTFTPIYTYPLNAKYFTFNDNFISQGKAAYKNYINELNTERFFSQNIASSEVGFIPLSFDLVLDGISGIKIYNKLSIRSEFLPSNYPSSLKFVITKVNHNISDNNWETSLSTVSMPETQPYKYNPAPSGGGSGGSGGSDNVNVSNNITGLLTPQPGQSGLLEPLKSIAAKYESGGKGYGASNTGTVDGCAFSNLTDVENMEFRELKRRMRLPSSPCDRNRILAAGKYQIIHTTMFGGNKDSNGNYLYDSGVWKQLGLTDTDKYTPEIQEKMFLQMMLNKTNLGNYITAKNEGTLPQLSAAIQDLSQLFASMPTIKRADGNIVGNVELGTGNTGYFLDAVNSKPKAVSIRQIAKIIVQTRINYKNSVPKEYPTYYTSPI